MDATGNHTQNQANRVADVSDALDALRPHEADRVWEAARKIYGQDDVSFLQAFELSLKADADRAARVRAYDSAYCREHDC